MTDVEILRKSQEELQNMDTFASAEALQEYASLDKLFPVEEDILNRYFPPAPAHVLDLGCGGGRTTAHLLKRGYKVTAGDIVPGMVEVTKNRLPGLDCRVLDATSLDLPSASFDVVWFSYNGLDYIYPFSSRMAALAEIKRVLKPGGVFVYSSHNILGRCTRITRPLMRCLIRYHLAFLYHSLRKPLLQNYWRENNNGDNWLSSYCGIPTRQIGTLRKAGFEPVSLESQYARSLWDITWKDFWPHYVARKPEISA